MALKYKKGDKVRIKSLDWYNENKDKYGDIRLGGTFFRDFMSQFCGSVVTIESIRLVVDIMCYKIKEDNGFYCWTDEMIEGLMEEKKTLCEGCCSLELKYNKLTIADNICTDKVEIILQDYELKREGDKWFAVKKKKECPKTLAACERILMDDLEECEMGVCSMAGYMFYELQNLQKLIICRDAYWKIAGEKLGLGKPWEPDWTNNNEIKFIIGVSENEFIKGYNGIAQYILAFPTEEMRDAFYENFKEEIEICKELL